MRRNLRAATWLMVLGGTAACTSILGDFETGNGVAPGPDASNDGQTQNDGNVGPVSDASPEASDGATDGPAVDGADAADLLLKCDGFKFANPILVASLDSQPAGQRALSDRPGIVSVSQDVARITLRRNQSSGFTVYTIDKNNLNNSASFDTPTNMNENQFRTTSTGAGLLTTSYLPGTTSTQLDLYTLTNTMSPKGPLPTPFTLVKGGIIPGNTNNFQANFFEITPNTDAFYAVTYQDPTTAQFSLQVGRAKGGVAAPTPLATAQKQFDNLAMLHVASSMRIFSSGDPSTGGAVVYSTPDDGTVAALATPRALSQSAGVPALLLDAVQGPGKGYNIGFIELDPNSTTALATFRVGAVDPAQIDTFKAHDLPLGPVINDASLLPVDKGSSVWYGDDLINIGRGSPATYPGLNWIWMDANGNVRAQNIGPDSILSKRNNVGMANASPAQKLGLKYQTWNVVWSETVSGDGGNDYDVVYLNELICH